MSSQPTQSQQRGYLWLTILLLAVSVAMICVVRCEGRQETDTLQVEQFQQDVDSFGGAIQQALSQEQPYRKGRREAAGHRPAPTTASGETTASAAPSRPRRQLTFELNTADTTDLQQLYGIGPTFARRIVQYRERLGGYVRLSQLCEVYGITPERYVQIAPQLTLDSSRRTRLHLNSATLDQLKRHPYLDYYQAKAIVNYRKSGIRYRTLDDLADVNTISDSTLQKIAPYIAFD